MKFHSIVLAATLAFAGTAFAAPKDTAPAPVSRNITHVVKVKHHAKHQAVHHRARAARHASMKHHKSMHAAHHQRAAGSTASAPSDMNSGSRPARMDEALQKFRANRG